MDPVNNDVKDALLGKLFVYFLGVFMPDIYICVCMPVSKMQRAIPAEISAYAGYDRNFSGLKACFCM